MSNPNANCEVCDSKFYASPGHIVKGWGKTCSIKCRTNAKPNPRFIENDVACKCCGQKFHVKPSRQKNGRGKVYCSESCRKMSVQVKKECKNCKKEFIVLKSRAGRKHYCTQMACRNARRPQVRSANCRCKSCGKDFYAKPSTIKRGNGGGSFCTVECMTKNRGRTRLADGKYASHLEIEMLGIINTLGVDSGMTREYMFHETRKWRLDFAWPAKKIAIEVQGGLWLGKSGGHTSGWGRARDMEKMNAATVRGWKVLEIAGEHLKNGQALEWLKGIFA